MTPVYDTVTTDYGDFMPKYLVHLVISSLLIVGASSAQNREQLPFLPTWKLLSRDQKRDFVAGYIQGWRDAAQVTDIAIGYVRDNPKQAVEGLEKIRRLYDLSSVRADGLVEGVDGFYSDPKNAAATLSAAVTAVRAAME